MNLLSRVRRLEGYRPKLPPEDECPAPMIGAEIEAGQPLPDEADVIPCRTCGGRHVQVIEEVVVEPEGTPT
jgi:hypothetical protein